MRRAEAVLKSVAESSVSGSIWLGLLWVADWHPTGMAPILLGMSGLVGFLAAAAFGVAADSRASGA